MVTEVQMDDMEVAEFACDRVNAPTQVALERGGIKDREGERESYGAEGPDRRTDFEMHKLTGSHERRVERIKENFKGTISMHLYLDSGLCTHTPCSVCVYMRHGHGCALLFIRRDSWP